MLLLPVLLLTFGALQPTPDAAPASPSLPAPPLVASPTACAQETEYEAGFNALSQGRDVDALQLFEHVLTACPQHPFAEEMARLAKTRLNPGARLAQATVMEMSRETPSGGARASLTVFQTMHGITQGILLCVVANCNAQTGVAVSLLGGGLGTTLALLGSANGITAGQAAAINSGTMWGLGYGLASMGSMDLHGDARVAMVMGSTLTFTGVGLFIATQLHPSAGQVSMANSGGLWAGVITGLFLGTINGRDSQTFFAVEQGVVSAGIIGMALLSRSEPVSQGRMLLIDAGGILGGLLGASLLFIADENNGDAILVGSGVGALAGLASATWLTHNFDLPAAPAVTIAPARLGRGAGAGLAVMGRF
ncbi:hypothetical protein DRW03_10390 [Corallococcus sp. H22C18031201]|uniref:hypothetical protein n=1 Tax=Citreicoccus inhibens TaxID=2849499 RepID=UPI000E73EB89|nr:hypothetical protein [Citreicoccus inhibens]MBU8898820.1 hypothetical protein [Citreicoccus inhibens]RJS24010.1 hypothetical protein DRW03_10390 [Corallococcus sp. H22C18031201]